MGLVEVEVVVVVVVVVAVVASKLFLETFGRENVLSGLTPRFISFRVLTSQPLTRFFLACSRKSE